MTVPDSSAFGPTGPGSGSPVRLDGPWTHRDVAANGARFHIAELGDGPLVLLLHGFPQFWWTWRHQLTALADAGFRAVAMDLRGVGGSDRTPRGYDPANLALDITGVIRSLGEPDAALVGHDMGGYLAWTAAVMRPKLVRRLRQSPRCRTRAGGGPPCSPTSHSPGRARTSGASSDRGCRSVSSWRTTRRWSAGFDPRLVGTAGGGVPRRRGGGRLPARDVHPVDGALLDRAVPLDGAVHGAPGRHPVQPQDEARGAGAHAASARFARSGGPYTECGRLRPVRRSAVPLATFRWSGSLPARGGSGRFLDRTHQLAQGSRAGPVGLATGSASGRAGVPARPTGGRKSTVVRRTANCPAHRPIG